MVKTGLILSLGLGLDQGLVGMFRVGLKDWAISYAYESPHRDRKRQVCVSVRSRVKPVPTISAKLGLRSFIGTEMNISPRTVNGYRCVMSTFTILEID